MAKRYGRNQRRQHRQHIEALRGIVEGMTIAVDASNQLIEHKNKEIESLEITLVNLKNQIHNWDHDIIMMLGRYSAFRFETPKLSAPGSLYRFPRPVEFSPVDIGNGAIGDEVMTSEAYVQLTRMIVESKADRFRLQQMIRLKFQGESGKMEPHLGYNIDGRQLMTMTARDRGELAEAIAHLMHESCEDFDRDNQRTRKSR